MSGIKIFPALAFLIVPFLLQLFFSALAFSHGSSSSEKQIETSLALFEKAISLSPEFLSTDTGHMEPFYQVNGHKIYLDQAFWQLTRAWMELYIQELESYCPCDLDPDVMIKQSKNYLPKNPLFYKASQFSQDSLSLGTHLTAKYGYTAAFLKVSAEVAETILSIFVGGKGVHVLCNAIDILIFPLARRIQQSFRIFSHGGDFSGSRLVFTARMAWLSRRINKSQKRVFFTIDEALEFNAQELARWNAQGPTSLFHKKGHRLLWLSDLKSKTDPLFEKIQTLEEELSDFWISNLSERSIKSKQKQIQKIRNKIDRLTQVNRNNFFGNRFKRYLLLRSRKGKKSYMNGHDLQHNFKFLMRRDFWPLGMQHLIESSVDKERWNLAQNHSEPFAENKTQSKEANKVAEIQSTVTERQSQAIDTVRENEAQNQATNEVTGNEKQAKVAENRTEHSFNKDPVISGLAEEFLQKISVGREGYLSQASVEFFLSDFDTIFDSNQKVEQRLLSARFVEMLLSQFFAHYLSLSKKRLFENNDISLRQQIRLHWRFGHIESLAYQFSDFLVSVAIAKKNISFYKYEAIEKFFSFLFYFNEVSLALKNPVLDIASFFSQLEQKEQQIRSLSLTKEKNTVISIVPFKKALPKCKDIIRKYQ